MPSGERSARVFAASASDPACGSLRQYAAIHSQLESLGRYFCFLRFGSEEQQRECADAGMRAMPAAERAIARELLGDHHDGSQIHFHAAIAFRRQHGFEPEGRRFAQQGDRDVEIAVLHFLDVRRDFFIEELARGAGNVVMFFGEIFRRENVVRRLVFYKEEAAGGFGARLRLP